MTTSTTPTPSSTLLSWRNASPGKVDLHQYLSQYFVLVHALTLHSHYTHTTLTLHSHYTHNTPLDDCSPRSKYHDPNYVLYNSYGVDLPSNAWLNSIVRQPGETKHRLIARAHRIVLPIQRCYLKRHAWRSHGAVQLQKIYRGYT